MIRMSILDWRISVNTCFLWAVESIQMRMIMRSLLRKTADQQMRSLLKIILPTIMISPQTHLCHRWIGNLLSCLFAICGIQGVSFRFHSYYGSLAQFLIAPLFTESSTEREVQAVDSEHNQNIPDDDWRHIEVVKKTSDPSHPYYKFGTGNS